jgi:archaemetzincin
MKYFYVGGTADLRTDADREALAAGGGRLGEEFGIAVRPIDLPSVDFTFDAARGQYASIGVLDTLAAAAPTNTAKLLAVTTRDLFIPVLTFVFGQAQLNGRVGVVSLARLRQEFYGLPADRGVFLDRAIKEALHESGHLFGLVHCADRACSMSLSTGVRQIDLKQSAFCGHCKGRFLRHSVENPHE